VYKTNNQSRLLLATLLTGVFGCSSVHEETSTEWILNLKDKSDWGYEYIPYQELKSLVDEDVEDLVPANYYWESDNLYRFRTPEPMTLDEVKDLVDLDQVESIEPVQFYTIQGKPNDPMYEDQWNMEAINVEDAWAASKARGRGVVVAVIDTGVGWKDHGDYKQLKDLSGTKFVSGKTFCSGLPDGLDDHGHGSHVAGTIAQTTNNGYGVVGIAPEATIMPLKVLSAEGYGDTAGIASAIRYAADNGAHVINMSLGGPYPSDIMQDAMTYAQEKGVVLVCAAGNDNSSRSGFPAGYDECLSVGALNREGTKAFYSNYGDDVDLSAPGGDKRSGEANGIVQQVPANPKGTAEGKFASYMGTSMASPHVAGVAALVVGQGFTNPLDVKTILIASTRHPDNWDSRMGAGALDAAQAVKKAGGSSGKPSWLTGKNALLFMLGLFGLGFVANLILMSVKKHQEKRRQENDESLN
jgi:serine protease